MQPTVTLHIGSKPVQAPRKPAATRDGCYWCGDPVAEDGHATQRYVIGHGMSHEACYRATKSPTATADASPLSAIARDVNAFTDRLKRPGHRTLFGPCTAVGYHAAAECVL